MIISIRERDYHRIDRVLEPKDLAFCVCLQERQSAVKNVVTNAYFKQMLWEKSAYSDLFGQISVRHGCRHFGDGSHLIR
jgi:hypothetical protein